MDDNKEYNMEDNFDPVDLQIGSALWKMAEAKKLIKEYKECKTANAKHLLRPKLDAIRATLHREDKEMKPIYDLLKDEQAGEEWKL